MVNIIEQSNGVKKVTIQTPYDSVTASINALTQTVAGKANQSDLDNTNVQLDDIVSQYSSTVPITGTWQLGNKVWNSNPEAGGNLGWICVQGGTFGGGNDPVFKQFGIISA